MAEKPHEQVETAPDPEEDDLDDLDDVLDKFEPSSASTKPSDSKPTTAPLASGPGRPSGQSSEHDKPPKIAPPGEEGFEKQLQAGMANLMSELDSNPDMQKQFEEMMKELIAAGAAPTNHEAGVHLREAAEAAPRAPPPTATKESAKSSETKLGSAEGGKKDDFNSTIRKTMERMQQSDATAKSSTTQPQSEDDVLAQMLADLQSAGGGGGGEGGEEDFNKMLMNMMSQLTNKEILYEPMKELHDKFPAWMERNQGKVAEAEMTRYKDQKRLVDEIVGRFERKGYSDDNEADREYIVDRMQKMQAAGSPPPDLVGDMSAAQEALGDLDAGCPQQ